MTIHWHLRNESEINDRTWKFKRTDENLRKSMNININRLQSMSIHNNLWKTKNMKDNRWESMTSKASLRESHKMYETKWESVEIYGINETQWKQHDQRIDGNDRRPIPVAGQLSVSLSLGSLCSSISLSKQGNIKCLSVSLSLCSLCSSISLSRSVNLDRETLSAYQCFSFLICLHQCF